MPDRPLTDRFLALAEVKQKVGLGHSNIYRMMADGRFPAARRVGEKAVRWLESELDAWMQACPKAGIEVGIEGEDPISDHIKSTH
ncbi:helix-turn-helix transcriptional regulator [Neoroseomonas terrae]|nr:AlpA family transcriptional regulator [Neoroseomonas terrae]